MPELISHASDNPEFARVVALRQLRDVEAFEFGIAPTAEEAAALARLLGALAVRKMRFTGKLTPLAGGVWRMEATLGVTVVQSCVVTLEPVSTRIDQPVHRRFLPGLAKGAELVIDPDEDEEVEPLGDRIDLGLVAIEALALALPAYPRTPGATFGPASVGQDGGEAEPRPFAALAALRGKLDNGS